jgi:2-polyprenyl-3-methyl-5-hydroxy-6-metoxy-1,4-benzoquinol methylase
MPDLEDAHPSAEKFDDYAAQYQALHAQNLAASGESTDYFSDYKLQCLLRAGVSTSAPLLDYGCGIGNVTKALAGGFSNVTGYDPSAESLKIAAQQAPSATFHDQPEALAEGHFETAVMSGVLHHIPPTERASVLEFVLSRLRPGGQLFVFEHNPINPLTQRAVATCPFDDDAILLWPWEAKKLLRTSGFVDVKLDYIVFFPRPLAALRPLEPSLGWLWLGAQQMLRATRSASDVP